MLLHSEIWPQGYNTFFMLNSAEHEILPANKQQITDKYSWERRRGEGLVPPLISCAQDTVGL